MTWFIFFGDMAVMAFMIIVVVAVSLGSSRETLEHSSRIPLEDEDRDG